MTDYNDGKWHGWNGGECPVDLGCLVEFQTIGGVPGRADHDPWAASDLSWFHDGDNSDLIAFRVTKPAPPKPRECWSYGAHIRDTEAEAIAFRQAVADANPGMGYELGPITKWIEVLP